MKIFKIKKIALRVFSCIFLTSFSQNVKISGKVNDQKTGSSLPFATVVLLAQGDSLLSGTTTGDKGEYTIRHQVMDDLELEVSNIGYKKKSIELPAPSGGAIEMTMKDLWQLYFYLYLLP